MTAIEFENISKQYRLGLVSTGTLRHDINRWWQTSILGREDPYLKIGETNDRATKGTSEYVWALRDINFKVEQGDVVGIIGKNGAGKSTLLKLLSQVTGPTTGTIKARGRIGSLLEVGTGFHGEMTGRENIYLNGAILGMTHQEISRKLDEIIDFSGCERYIDTPVKRYSSGMMVRLGFAVAAHLDPEILVVDEVLAVGDAEFQKKAIGKMKDVSQGEGRTVLFVSHNMGNIRALCNNSILLENGMLKSQGKTEDIVDYYLSDATNQSDLMIAERKRELKVSSEVIIEDIFLESLSGNVISSVLTGQDFYVCMKYKKNSIESVNKVNVSLSLTDYNQQPQFLIHSRMTGDRMDFKYKEGIIKCFFKKIPLNQGTYNLSFSLMAEEGRGGYIDQLENAFKLTVENGDFYRTGEIAPINFGHLVVDGKFTIQ